MPSWWRGVERRVNRDAPACDGATRRGSYGAEVTLRLNRLTTGSSTPTLHPLLVRIPTAMRGTISAVAARLYAIRAVVRSFMISMREQETGNREQRLAVGEENIRGDDGGA